MSKNIIWLDKIGMADVSRVGGKNASLGEMISNLSHSQVNVPGGFATTADAYREFLNHGQLSDRIAKLLSSLDTEDVNALAAAGKIIRQWIVDTPFPTQLEKDICTAYKKLGETDTVVAVRSSATAEDLPDASFAGQQETFLNICGENNVLNPSKTCSLRFTMTEPFPIAFIKDSTTVMWPCQRASNVWYVAISVPAV
jgi:pyruvate,water dikinase